jgi:hypothetical protein
MGEFILVRFSPRRLTRYEPAPRLGVLFWNGLCSHRVGNPMLLPLRLKAQGTSGERHLHTFPRRAIRNHFFFCSILMRNETGINVIKSKYDEHQYLFDRRNKITLCWNIRWVHFRCMEWSWRGDLGRKSASQTTKNCEIPHVEIVQALPF